MFGLWIIAFVAILFLLYMDTVYRINEIIHDFRGRKFFPAWFGLARLIAVFIVIVGSLEIAFYGKSMP
jgi:hypothetical protein